MAGSQGRSERRCGAGRASVRLLWVQPLQSEKGMVGGVVPAPELGPISAPSQNDRVMCVAPARVSSSVC